MQQDKNYVTVKYKFFKDFKLSSLMLTFFYPPFQYNYYCQLLFYQDYRNSNYTIYIYIMHKLPYTKHVKICQIVNPKCSEDEGLSVAFDVQFKRKFQKKSQKPEHQSHLTFKSIVIFTLCVKCFFLAFNFLIVWKDLDRTLTQNPRKRE